MYCDLLTSVSFVVKYVTHLNHNPDINTFDSASYMKNGQTVHVPGSDLLRSAIPCERFPMMRIEVRYVAEYTMTYIR